MLFPFSGWQLLLPLILAWWYLCSERVKDWRSVEQITLVDGLKQLRSSRTQFNLANLYLQSPLASKSDGYDAFSALRQRLDEALAAYRRSVAADPQERDAQPLYHAGQILMYQGDLEVGLTIFEMPRSVCGGGGLPAQGGHGLLQPPDLA